MSSREHAIAFLNAVFPAINSSVIVRFVAKKAGHIVTAFHSEPTSPALDQMLALNLEGYEVFVQINPCRSEPHPDEPPWDQHGYGSLKNLAYVSTIALDFDTAKKRTLHPKTVLDRLYHLGMPLSIMVNSGGGGHVYLLLDRPYTVEETQQTAKRLCMFLDADRTHNANRDMRLPGTYNWKEGAPVPCYLLHCKEFRYSISAITAALDEAHVPTFDASQTPPSLQEPVANLETLLEALPARLRGAYLNGPPPGVDISEKIDYPIACQLAKAGATDQQIADVICRIPRAKGRTTSYLQRTIQSARRTVAADFAEATEVPTWVADSKGLYYIESGRVRLNVDIARGLIAREMNKALASNAYVS